MRFDWSQVTYFQGIDACDTGKIDHAARFHTYQPGATIFSEGDSCAGFHVVVDGLVRIFRVNAEGRLHTLSLLRPPATFNEVAAVDGRSNPFNAVAVTYAEVLVIPHERLLKLLSISPVLLQNAMQALAHLNREYIERLEDMTFRSIPSRLAKLFLHETTYHDQIAETPILGTTREVVGRALRELLNAGLLEKRGRAVYVVDRGGLEYLAATNTMPVRHPLA